MKNEIIRRNVIITVIAIVLFFLASFSITSYFNRKSIENQLLSVSNVLIKEVEDEDDIDIIKDKVNHWIESQSYLKIVLASSDGTFIIDSENDSLNQVQRVYLNSSELDDSKELKDHDRIYSESGVIYYISTLSSGYIIRTGINYSLESGYILLASFIMLALIIAVIIISIISSSRTSDRIVNTLSDISNHLETINDGEYKEIEPSNNYPEVEPIIAEINEINDNINTYLKQTVQERDKINYIMNNLSEGLMILDEFGNILLQNEYVKNSFGYPDLKNESTSYKDEIKNPKLLEQIEIALNSKTNKYFDIELDSLGKTYSFNLSFIKRSWNELDKKQSLLLITIVDVTEERRNDKTRKDFISNASHELKTPVTSIKGFTELIKMDESKLDDKTKDYIDTIYSESIKMKKIIDERLFLSKLDSNYTSEDIEELSISNQVYEILNSYKLDIKDKNLKVNLDMTDSYINANYNVLYHIIKNIIENAIKYNKENGTIDIKVYEENNSVILTISDSGIGIDEKYLPRIYDRFWRADKSHNKQTGGSGLGLNIVKECIRILNAKIEVNSKLNEGTSFKIIFNKGN